MFEAYPRGGMDANTPRGVPRVQFSALDGVLGRKKPCYDWVLTLCVPAVETVTQGFGHYICTHLHRIRPHQPHPICRDT